MQISDFDYELPDRLIGQRPAEPRDASRMLIVDREANAFTDARFSSLPERLGPRDVVVINNTKVFPARLRGRTETGASVEIFLVRDLGLPNLWEALVRPARRLKVGKVIRFPEDTEAVVRERLEGGRAVVEFSGCDDLLATLWRIGSTPLPPYVRRTEGESPDTDRERYQTVYARESGAIAAPTAGLHFTPKVLNEVRARGAQIVEITLHVGYGTFEPVRVDDPAEHRVLPEHYEIASDEAELLTSALHSGKRIVAVGTTTIRALESAIDDKDVFRPGSSLTDLTILPGYRFRVVGALLTNFHLPKSSLLILVSTFGGHELIMNAYTYAVQNEYRFYSYGDCMFIE